VNESYTAFNLFNSKDVRLPVQLQRAMAAEAEAAREARAKVTTLQNDETSFSEASHFYAFLFLLIFLYI
jgi:hypothetical protein